MISCVPRLPLELSFLSGFQAPAFFQFLEYTMFPFILGPLQKQLILSQESFSYALPFCAITGLFESQFKASLVA